MNSKKAKCNLDGLPLEPDDINAIAGFTKFLGKYKAHEQAIRDAEELVVKLKKEFVDLVHEYNDQIVIESKMNYCIGCETKHLENEHVDNCPKCFHRYKQIPCNEMTDYGPCNSDYKYCKCNHEFHRTY